MLKRARAKLADIAAALQSSAMAQRRGLYEQLRAEIAHAQPRSLAAHGAKVFSQSDEDGIIAEIFRRIGTTNRRFIEFGVGNGLENNTVALLYQGWSGLWIEGSSEFCSQIDNGYRSAIAGGQLKLVNSFITRDNIERLISANNDDVDIDLLSIDIDGNDAHVLQRMQTIMPRVIVLEYNAKFGPTIDYCMGYDADYVWRKSDMFGASLKHLELLLRDRGFSLVGCNLIGTNAFFVRDDQISGLFEGPFTSEAQFQPPRYELAGLSSGHPPVHATFETRVR